jgi:anaerobic magnesium-protoporphyrin IX monomethyl ester cyclase
MNILVVHPHYPGIPSIRYMPLGLALVAAVAEREGYNVRVIDLHNRSLPYSDLDEELLKNHYPLIVAGGFGMQVHSMREIVRRVRRHSAGSKVLLGGVGVSDAAEIALDYTGADAVCAQEAELVLPDMLRAVDERRGFEDCFGIVYRSGETTVRRPGGPIPNDLDELPFRAYHLFDIDGIAPTSYNGWGAKKSIHIMSSRGCPFRCTFCINSLLNDKGYRAENFGKSFTGSKKPQRLRSPESVVREIEFLRRRYGIRDFHFADEEFITHKDHLFRICAALKGLGVTWSTSARADWATEEKLAAMKEAGCRFVLFGIESGSQKLLDLMEKKAKAARAAEGIVNCYKVGLRFWPNMMIGYPGETRETIMETVAFCKALKIPYEASFVTLFPNSKLFHDMKHRITDWEWYFSTLANMDFSSKVLLNMSELADEELKELRRWVSDECKKTAAQEYIVDFSSGIHKKRWSAPLPPPSGPPVREVPKMLLEAGRSLGHADGFEESLKELELSVN